MLLPRIIPCLLLTKDGLVKTENFKNPNYIGDPINTVKIFNEKKADELIILDIHATTQNYEPNYKLIDKLARESKMPICYGGGIKNLDQAKKIFSFGIEKIGLSSIIFSNLKIISEISNYAGSQSTVVVLDIFKENNEYFIFINNGKTKIDENFDNFIVKLQDEGVGEIVVNSINKDGSMSGFDFDLINKIFYLTKIPITVLGGAKDYSDIENVVKKYGSIGIAAGSLFVYKGSRKAVLINYPIKTDKIKIFNNLIKDV
tara:strand:- start:1910 stop:2686 length:777 start_codon:yes stop_codon:yes gene_type:complete